MKSGETVGGMRKIDLAYVKLASSEIARDINRDVILELIRANQPASRAELSRLSGLQRSTVSLIVDQLILERWVREGAVLSRPCPVMPSAAASRKPKQTWAAFRRAKPQTLANT